MKKPVLLNVFLHIAGWLLFFAFFLVFASENNHVQNPFTLLVTREFVWFAFIYLFIFYFHNLLVFKALYLRKYYLLYFLVFCLLMSGVYYLRPFDNLVHNISSLNLGPSLSFGDPIQHDNVGAAPFKHGPGIDVISLIIFVFIWLLGAASQLTLQWQTVQAKAARAEVEKAAAELAFLKAQINPHFLFNSLNNIYSLAVSKSDNTPGAIMRLSQIMRYITDEVGTDFVPLQSEAACISDYIDLQRLRLNKKVNIDFSVKGDAEAKKIAPLILIPFVENIFKYGISNHEPCDIIIKLVAEPQKIYFYCKNKIYQQNHLERSGIGLDNTRKRLELVYDGNCTLDINKDNGFFTVALSLNV